MRRLKEDIGIIVLSLLIAAVSASYFLGFLQREKEAETQDLYYLLPTQPKSVLAINQPTAFAHLLLEKTPGVDILQRWIPEAFLYLLRQEPKTPFLLFSFHQEGVICYAKANKKQAEKLEHDILRSYFSAYEPQEETLHDIRFRYYADTGSRFLGCYQHEGVWVASYSKRLLEQVVRKQLLPQEQTDEDSLSPFFRQFDRNATANLLFPSDGWQIQVARHDTILWKYNLPWVCTDLFPSEGNICGFCSFPYAVPNDSLYEAMGDSLAIQLEALFPRLHVTPQTSQDSSEVYFTFCSPL